MEAQIPQSLSECNLCGKKFQRKAHLMRHLQQHSGEKPYVCKFCEKTFKRSDVLRDHFRRCEKRGSAEIPSSLERGRKRHACDECSRLKVKCDNEIPCRKCKEFGRTCVKNRSTAVSSPETTSATTTPDPTGSDRNSIGFLLNCPGETDFMREFPKDNTLSPNSKAADFANFIPSQNGYGPVSSELSGATMPTYNEYGNVGVEGNSSNLDAFLRHLEFGTFEQQTHNFQMPGENIMLWSSPDPLFLDQAVLEQRAFRIREKLKYTAAIINPPLSPSKEVLDAIEIITANKIASWLKLYFRHWHKHGPMVHEATFNPCKAALPLVISLMSLGGMYSMEKEDVEKLKLLLDIIEAYIYSIPGINDEYDLPGRRYVRQGDSVSLERQCYQLEEFQGAYLIIVLQFWTGNPTARIRVRQQRYARISAIMHHLEMQVVQHPPNFVINDEQSFRRWILKESYIRTSTIAIMLDNAFGIFNNVPPRFQWAEIDLTFPSDDIYFRTANYDELLATQRFPIPKMKIKDAFMILFTPPEKAAERLKVLRDGNLTALDMQMLIHFLYTHVWNALFLSPLIHLPSPSPDPNEPNPIIQTLLTPFRHALRNWRTVWDGIQSSTPSTEWEKLGFQRTATTYFDAVSSIIEVWERRGGKFPPLESDCEKGLHLKRLLSF